MLVVETSSSGAEILCRMVPDAKERLVVRLRRGISGTTSVVLAFRLVVNALERDMFLRR
jgi:hypothetical protein